MKLPLTFSGIALIICAFACSQPNETAAKAPLNPNGDSELALLMRVMFDDGMRVKSQIQKGEKPEIKVEFQKILTAKPTTPDMIDFEGYVPFANDYISAMQALESAAPETAQPLYVRMVATCVNCHNASCKGPLMRIEKMYWAEEEE